MAAYREVPGSSPLTPAQQEEMLARYGHRYHAVADGGRYPTPKTKTLAASVKTRRPR